MVAKEPDLEVDEFLSGSEDETETTAAHANLLADMQGIMKKNKRRVAGGTMRCVAQGGNGVDLSAITGLCKDIPVSDFKEAAPSSKLQERRVERKYGYKQMAEDVNKWEGVVKQNRMSEQLSFPLTKNSVSIKEVDSSYKPLMKSDLEKEMYALLDGAGMSKPKETEEARAVREAMSLEEVMLRNKEAWQVRTLKGKLGKKAFIRNKTKSKNFHRIMKKDRLKKQAAELMKLQKTDPDKAIDKLQELEDIRIEERMTLKHKKSKWALALQARAKTDKNALAALQENSRLHKDLVQKLQKKGKEESEESSDSDEDDESTGVDTEAATLNSIPAPAVEEHSYTKMKQFWGEYNKQMEEENKEKLLKMRERRKQNDKGDDVRTIEEAESIIQEKLAATKTKKKAKTTKAPADDVRPNISQYEFSFSSTDKPDNHMNEVVQRKKTLEDYEGLEPESESRVSTTDIKNATDTAVKEKKKGLPEIDATKIKTLQPKILPGGAKSITNLFRGEGEERGEEDQALFDDDDFALEQFMKDKKEADDAATPKDVSHALPGWGDWTGPGIKMSEKKINKHLEKAPPKPPSKYDKNHVIYNESADMHHNIRIRMVSEVPHPFRRVSDWEASMRGPLGRTFVPELVHRQNIKPAMVTELGTVIKPMDISQLLNTPDIKEGVKKRLARDELQRAKREDAPKKEKIVRPGNEIINLGGNKKRKFSRKSTT